MEYFELVQDKRVENPIKILGLDPNHYKYNMTEGNFHSLSRLKAAYYRGDGEVEVCGVIFSPVFMVIEPVKRLFEAYDKTIKYKAVQLYPKDRGNGQSPLYWIVWLTETNCLHPKTRRYGNGMLQELVLDGSATGNRDILKIPVGIGCQMVVSLAFAESLLRRGIYGIGLKRLEVL